MMVEQSNRYGGTVEQRWWNSGTEMVEPWKNDGGPVENYGGTVEQIWRNSGTVMEEKWNRYGGTVEQIWWNSETEMVEQ